MPHTIGEPGKGSKETREVRAKDPYPGVGKWRSKALAAPIHWWDLEADPGSVFAKGVSPDYADWLGLASLAW